MKETRPVIFSARTNFYKFLSEHYHQRYLGYGGKVGVIVNDYSWSGKNREDYRNEIERLLELHQIKERFDTVYIHTYGILDVDTKLKEDKHGD